MQHKCPIGNRAYASMKHVPLIMLLVGLLVGCNSLPTNTERGPDGTIVYKVPVETSEPGGRIEVNGESIGTAPLILKIYGDPDGTFHSFGGYEFVVRAYPPEANRPPLTKVYKTGALFAAEDKIPEKIYFDFGARPATPSKP